MMRRSASVGCPVISRINCYTIWFSRLPDGARPEPQLVHVFSPQPHEFDGFGLPEPSFRHNQIGIPFREIGRDVLKARARRDTFHE